MNNKFVIPYHDKTNEKIYQVYVDQVLWLCTKTCISLPRHTVLVDIARNCIINQLVTYNSYQQYYTLHQINHIAQLMANAIQNEQDTLYKY